MQEFHANHIRANCPDCNGAISNFLIMDRVGGGLAGLKTSMPHHYQNHPFDTIIYQLVQCAGCGRGGFCKIHFNSNSGRGVIEEFYPLTTEISKIPEQTPDDIKTEFREAETCASIKAWRSATAMLRSTLEKILKKNGYVKGSLENKIDEAASDGILTSTRQKKAHDEIRSLGNDILHDEWRAITEEEYLTSHHYAQRIIEDFYDDRITVEKTLKEKGKIK